MARQGKWSDRNVWKSRFEQTDEELSKSINTKLAAVAADCAEGIKKHWRIKGHWKEFDQTRDEMIYIIRWLEDLDIEKFMELLLMDFTRWNTEFFNTAGWLQTIHDWKNPSNNRRDEAFEDKNFKGGTRFIFDDKEEHKKFVEYQEKKNIIADALEESGVGHG